MRISIIVAISKNNIIGNENRLPWNLPSDLKYFKEKTMGHYILMGRKTFESIDSNLQGRKIIIVSRKIQSYKPKDIFLVHSITKGINLAKNAGEPELFVVGGATLFNRTLKFADRLYLTEINNEFEGDTYFPEINFSNWKLFNSSKTFLENDINFRFMTYQRNNLRLRRDDRDE
ncbi:MAG: dihydrofolate reductase [Candidatus Cloacimonetes bacterium]|nr:dihydrofolate reductase [Candidatus Cloacimonadota bacterium]